VLGLVSLMCGVHPAAAQPAASLADVRSQLDQVVGNRVEATVLLGGQKAPQGGLFAWQFNDVDARILKYPWNTDLAAPRPLGVGRLQWAPVLLGSIGAGHFANHFGDGPLVGSTSTYDTYSLGLGAGPRVWLLPELSVLPSFSLLYAYTENDFDAGTEAGEAAEQVVDGRLVDWHTHTLTFIPSIELRYRRPFGPVTITLTSTYTYFATTPIARSTDAYSFTSDSQIWSNRAELGVTTPWSVARWPVLAGGFFERMDLWGGLRESLRTDYVHAVGGHVALDPGGMLWKMTEVGVAASYFWSGSFSGWTLGVDWAVTF
jgi:hypothetical protein